VPLTKQRVAVLGVGSAGCGIVGLIRAATRDYLLESEPKVRRRTTIVQKKTGRAVQSEITVVDYDGAAST
jgi:malic enzyme